MRIESLWPAQKAGTTIATFDVVLPDGSRHCDWRLKRNSEGYHSVFAPKRQGVPHALRGPVASIAVTAAAKSAFYGDQARG